jgi:archaellum component FlaG (FlaF/FlaG flagellin family)
VHESSGSIGIGAMIVFIALILVAAVASSVIIKSAEELSEKTDQSRDDRQFSKVEISDIQVFNYEPCWVHSHTDPETCPSGYPRDKGHYELVMYFSILGDVELQASEIHYQVSCGGETLPILSNFRIVTFGTQSTWDSQSSLDQGYTGAPFNRQAVVLPGEEKDNTATSIGILEPGITYAVMIDLFDNQNTAGEADDEGCRISLDFVIDLNVFVEGGIDTYAIIDCDSYLLGSSCY